MVRPAASAGYHGLQYANAHLVRPAATAGYRDAGVDLIIVNLPLHAKPDSLPPLAEALTPLA